MKSSKKFKSVKGREYEVSLVTIQGKQPGPVLALIAGQHGMEHIGPIMLTELIDELDPASFRGTLHVCPNANPAALELDYEFYPEREDLSTLDAYFYSRARHDYCIYGMERQKGPNWYNMNRLWNRREPRGMAGEITAWLWEQAVLPADAVIDFHCLQAEKPLIYGANRRSNPLASLFGIEAIWIMNEHPDDFNGGNLDYQLHSDGRRLGFCVEFSLQHGIKPHEIPLGKRGVLNTMKALGMLEGELKLERPCWFVEKVASLKTQHRAHPHYRFGEYDAVRKGDVLVELRSLETLEVVERLTAPDDGILGRRTWRGVTVPGESVCELITATKLREAGVQRDRITLPPRAGG